MPVPHGETVPYDRAVLVEVVVYHYRESIKGCSCGWSELGKSWAEHVADVYEARVKVLPHSELGGDPPAFLYGGV